MKKQRWLLVTIALCIADCFGLGLLSTLSRPVSVTHKLIDTEDILSLQGTRVDSSKPACRLIHYTAKTCPFCAQEMSIWSALKSDALAAKCNVIVVVPNITELPLSSQPDTALFVSTEFARTLGATRTPTTVLTTANGSILWEKEGMMSSSDRQDARSILTQRPR